MKRQEITYRIELENLIEKYFRVPLPDTLAEIVVKIRNYRLAGVVGKKSVKVNRLTNKEN
jgi:hypothetical protein